MTLRSPAVLARIAMLQPALRAVALPLMDDVEQATGKKVTVTRRGAVRTYADQVALYDARGSNPYPVAEPGTSMHEVGAALDIAIAGGTDDDYRALKTFAEDTYGLKSLWPDDPIHVQLNESFDQAQADWLNLQPGRNLLLIGAGVVAVAIALAFTSGDDD